MRGFVTSGQSSPVSAPRFGLVKAVVGDLQQLLGRIGVIRECGNANRNAHAAEGLVFVGKLHALCFETQSIGANDGTFRRSFRQNHRELLAADTAAHIAGAEEAAQ